MISSVLLRSFWNKELLKGEDLKYIKEIHSESNLTPSPSLPSNTYINSPVGPPSEPPSPTHQTHQLQNFSIQIPILDFKDISNLFHYSSFLFCTYLSLNKYFVWYFSYYYHLLRFLSWILLTNIRVRAENRRVLCRGEGKMA